VAGLAVKASAVAPSPFHVVDSPSCLPSIRIALARRSPTPPPMTCERDPRSRRDSNDALRRFDRRHPLLRLRPRVRCPVAVRGRRRHVRAQQSQFLVNFAGSYTYVTTTGLKRRDRWASKKNLGLGYFISREAEIGADLFMQYRSALDIAAARAPTATRCCHTTTTTTLSPRLSVHAGPTLEFFSLTRATARQRLRIRGPDRRALLGHAGRELVGGARYTHRKLSSGSIDKEDEFQTLFGLNFRVVMRPRFRNASGGRWPWLRSRPCSPLHPRRC